MLHERVDQRKPNGGFAETAAKAVYLAALIACIVTFAKHHAIREAKSIATDEQNRATVKRANEISTTIFANGKTPSDEQIVNARNELVHLINGNGTIPAEWASEHVRSVMALTVERTMHEMESKMMLAPTVIQRQEAIWRRNELLNRMTMNDPYNGKGIGYGEVPRGLWKIAKAAFAAYILFIPIAFICFAARLAKSKYRLSDELMFGKRELAINLLFWPFGLSAYPERSALALRRMQVDSEYRVRKGYSFREELSDTDLAEIEVLVLAPRAELAARLNAICELPWHLVLKAKFAFCVSLVAGFLFSAMSFNRGNAYAAEAADAADATAQVVPPENKPKALQASGFASALAKTSGDSLGFERLFLFGDANPADGLNVSLIGNLAGTPQLLQAMATARYGRYGLKFGEMFLPAGYHVPAPSQERIIGGPGTEAVAFFIDIGVQLFAEYGWGSLSLACVSGAGPNKPDNNRAKDLIFAVDAGHGPARLKLSVQEGQQPTGFRLLASALASLKLGPVDVAENGIWNDDAGQRYGGLSSFIGWRATPRLDFALQHDAIRPLGAPQYQRISVQTTLFGWKEKVSLGLHGFWNSLSGFGSQARLQFSF
jgi:hypothetical protein